MTTTSIDLRRLALGAAAIVLAGSAGLSGQSLRIGPRFEVASVKENNLETSRGMLTVLPGGNVLGRHITAATMIRFSYELEAYQLVSVPEWAGRTYYDVMAKPSSPSVRAESLAMIRALLADRFKLTVHREMRMMEGFALVRTDAGRLGPTLKQSAIDCVKDHPEACRDGLITRNSFRQVGLPLNRLTAVLASALQMPVTDETGLAGPYDAELHWSSDGTGVDDSPVISTALQEQLGLRLRAGRFRHEVVVVDHIERADPD